MRGILLSAVLLFVLASDKCESDKGTVDNAPSQRGVEMQDAGPTPMPMKEVEPTRPTPAELYEEQKTATAKPKMPQRPGVGRRV